MSYEPQLHIVLHEPEIPQNTGNIGRTCLALRAKLWLVKPLGFRGRWHTALADRLIGSALIAGRTDPESGFRVDQKSLRRAGLDYWQHLNWQVVEDWASLQAELPDREPWLFTKTASGLYTEAHFQDVEVLVFGSETRGLPQELLAAHPTRQLRIPIYEPVRSLNLSAAVAVAAFETVRQIRG